MRMMIGLVLACSAASANAAVTVIGSSAARSCFEAARAARTSRAAIAHCDAALATGPLSRDDEVATHVNRGILRAVAGDEAGAVADYDAALAIDAAEPEAYLNKGFLLLRGARAAAAVPMFDAAVVHRTSEPRLAHYGRAVAHEQLGDLRAALSDYRRASELAPDWDAPRLELSRFKVRDLGADRGR